MANDAKESLPHDRTLRGLRPVQAAPVLEARTRANRREEFHVVLGRQERLPRREVIESLCQGLGWDTWSTIRRLEAPTPRIVRRESSMDTAQYWVGWMRELGLVAFAVPESQLAEARVHEAVSLTREPQALVVAASDGTLHRVCAEDAICIVWGDVRTRTVRTAQVEGKVVKEVVRDDSEGMMDVHLRAGEAVLRFRQSVLRYSEFLEECDGGSMALFARVRDVVRGGLAGVAAHKDFQAAVGSLGESWRILERSRDVVAKFHGGMALADVEVAENSDMPLFQLWSLLLRFQGLVR